MQHITPLWYKLIFYWCRIRVPKGYGLTIPFIMGAIKQESITALLKEIRDIELPEKIILRVCYDLNEYVLSVDDTVYPISTRLKGDGSLLFYDDKIESLHSFEEKSSFLEDKYAPIIKDHNYSKNMRSERWEPFTDLDREFINAVIADK